MMQIGMEVPNNSKSLTFTMIVLNTVNLTNI